MSPFVHLKVYIMIVIRRKGGGGVWFSVQSHVLVGVVYRKVYGGREASDSLRHFDKKRQSGAESHSFC